MSNTTSDAEGYAEIALLIRSFQISKMLEVAATLDLADRIGNECRPAAQLARECGADSEMLLRLCRALAAFGIFSVDAKGGVSQTSRSAWLRRSSKPTLHYAVRYWMMPSIWAAWGNLESSIQSAKPAFEVAFGTTKWEYLKAHPQESELFDLFMENSP